MADKKMVIEVNNIDKSFGAYQALKGVDLRVQEGEFVALLGPSGSGKTTLLRIIAGLEFPDSGNILFSGEDALRRNLRDRKVGFVFQHYALFRHMTVLENVAYGLRVRPRRERLPKEEITKRAMDLLRLVQIDWHAHSYANQLSGGQRQRVALARALAIEPKVLLLDEPFGALDAKVRKELRRWLRQLHEEMGITSIFVTHDQEEAMEMADRVVVMNEGRIVQSGTPQDVYHMPATPFVYEFLGSINCFKGKVENGIFHYGELRLDVSRDVDNSVKEGLLYVRPHHVIVERTVPENIASLPAKVHFISTIGPLVNAGLEVAGQENIVEVAMPHFHYEKLKLKTGDEVRIRFAETKLFPAEAR